MSPFPPDFFTRADDGPDDQFYEFDRFVTHIDDRAIAAVGGLYEHLGLDGRVLDLMSSWISHFREPPRELVALGMNERELAANQAATSYVVHDLNTTPRLPFDDACFEAVTCCVSVDYLVQPIPVFAEARRVLVPGGVMVNTFSNRCFPTKAIRGWLANTEEDRCRIVTEYFHHSGGWNEPQVALCTPPNTPGDPLYAVWATTAPE
jgi:SAM-dependent methyltransferase